jgi:hypothetical protein
MLGLENKVVNLAPEQSLRELAGCEKAHFSTSLWKTHIRPISLGHMQGVLKVLEKIARNQQADRCKTIL